MCCHGVFGLDMFSWHGWQRSAAYARTFLAAKNQALLRWLYSGLVSSVWVLRVQGALSCYSGLCIMAKIKVQPLAVYSHWPPLKVKVLHMRCGVGAP